MDGTRIDAIITPVITFPILQPVDGYTATGFLWARARPAVSILSGVYSDIRDTGALTGSECSDVEECGVATRRRIRQKPVAVGGKIMFGTIMTCLPT